jgi:hypothetical protein
MTPRPYTLLAPETPIEAAIEAWADHIRACTYCRQGRPCDVGDPLDRRLTEAASGDLPWPDTSFQIGNNSTTEDKP